MSVTQFPSSPSAAPAEEAPQVLVDPKPPVHLMEFVLPPQAVVFLGLFILLMPLTVLAGESLLVPLFESGRVLFAPDSALRFDLPWHFYFKLGVFGVLTFFGFFQIMLRLKLSYYEAWVHLFSRPDPLHLDYFVDPQQSILAILSWTLYRNFVLWAPPVFLGVATGLIGVGELYLFNVMVDLPPAAMPAMIIGFLFLVLVLMVLFGFLCLKSIWNGILTAFGDVIAITEPDLPAKLVFARCQRIAFATKAVWLLYPFYFIFVSMVLFEIGLLVTLYDIHEVITFQVNVLPIIGLSALTVGMYLVLNFCKLFTYHDALVHYYQGLPKAFRERFSPPQAVAI